MNPFIPFISIIIALLVYFGFAISASFLIKKFGADIKNMEGRTSSFVLYVGLFANLAVLVCILLLLKYVDGRDLSALGLVFAEKDLLFSITSSVLIILSAVSYLFLLKTKGTIRLVAISPSKSLNETAGLFGTAIMLVAVALMEETLYRGYITLNLESFSPFIIVIITTALFTVIHFFTNRVTVYQVLSWIIGGAVLIYAYLLSGSIWVPVVIHFFMDLTNVIILNIAGRYSFFKTDPVLTVKQRFTYRAASSIIIVIMLIIFYGTVINFN